MDCHGLTGNRDDLLAEIDLHLLTRLGLEPDGGQGPGAGLLTERRDGPLQGPELDLDPLGGEFGVPVRPTSVSRWNSARPEGSNTFITPDRARRASGPTASLLVLNQGTGASGRSYFNSNTYT